MKQQEYMKIIETELQRINKIIDQKIISGQEYSREARDHKLLLRKVRQNRTSGFFSRLFPVLSHF